MGAACSNGDVSFEQREGVAGQDDIAVTIFTKHLQLPPSDLDKFLGVFLKLQAIEADLRAREVARRSLAEQSAAVTNTNEFDEAGAGGGQRLEAGQGQVQGAEVVADIHKGEEVMCES
jgi:hypothetical protein